MTTLDLDDDVRRSSLHNFVKNLYLDMNINVNWKKNLEDDESVFDVKVECCR